MTENQNLQINPDRCFDGTRTHTGSAAFRACVYEYGWWDDPTTPSPSCHLRLVIPPCAAAVPVMNSSLSGCCAAEQRGSFVPRPSQAGRPIDDMLGLISDCGPLVPVSLQIYHWNVSHGSEEVGVFWFFSIPPH